MVPWRAPRRSRRKTHIRLHSAATPRNIKSVGCCSRAISMNFSPLTSPEACARKRICEKGPVLWSHRDIYIQGPVLGFLISILYIKRNQHVICPISSPNSPQDNLPAVLNSPLLLQNTSAPLCSLQKHVFPVLFPGVFRRSIWSVCRRPILAKSHIDNQRNCTKCVGRWFKTGVR